jgi:hypothetical protein
MASTPEKFTQFPFGELVRQVAMAVADAQLALDMNGAQTAQLLADIKFDPNSVILALVETVDADGNVESVDTLMNSQPLSLMAWGLNPTFIEFSETVIDIKYVAYMRTYEYNRDAQSEFSRKLKTKYQASKTKWGAGGGLSLNLGFFKIGGGGGYSSASRESEYSSELVVSSATSVAVSSKVEGDWGQCRVTATLRPKDPPARLIPQVIQKTAG